MFKYHVKEGRYGVKVSAVQAAHLIGRNERRIRDWIATQRLPAIKVGQAWQIDTEDLERIPGIKIDYDQLALLQAHENHTQAALLNRIAELEHMVEGLHAVIADLNTRIVTIEHLQNGNFEIQGRGLTTEHQLRNWQQYMDTFRSTKEDDFLSIQGREPLPPGSVRMKQFALLHKVHAAVLIYQIETGKIEDTSVSMANGRKAHWFTPEQQRQVIAFWKRNGTQFFPCPHCPLHGSHTQR